MPDPQSSMPTPSAPQPCAAKSFRPVRDVAVPGKTGRLVLSVDVTKHPHLYDAVRAYGGDSPGAIKRAMLDLLLDAYEVGKLRPADHAAAPDYNPAFG